MPDYTITLKSTSIYGPFTYGNHSQLKADFLAGKLPLTEDNAIILDQLQGVTVKEVKPEK